MNIKIVIAVNKKDLWFCRICVASIRYYYPDVEIAIIKDYLNGTFDTKEIEKHFNVGVLDLGIKKYGWAVSKMHVLLSEMSDERKILLLDSDIVFIGKFLEKLVHDSQNFDFTVDAHFLNYSDTAWMKDTYYDLSFFQSLNPDFKYPGYVFNTGQMLISPGLLKSNDISAFFDLTKYPYWKNRKNLPSVDQSLLNYILPYKEQKKEIKIRKAKFMYWSESKETQKLDLSEILKGDKYSFLIHWAGAKRTPFLEKMIRPDLLLSFENYYYSRISFAKFKREIRRKRWLLNSIKLRLINRLKLFL